MFISQIRIENFRLFGSAENAFFLNLTPGLTALVGDNDAGKTAVIDALRFVLRTTDQEHFYPQLTDFHVSLDGKRAEQIVIRCRFEGLTSQDRGAFAEYLTYEQTKGATNVVLYILWIARRTEKQGTSRRYSPAEWRSGESGDGVLVDPIARSLLEATYLRPLRDAERAMSSGRGSRLSQILQHTKEVKGEGVAFKKDEPVEDPMRLSVLGIGDYANYLLDSSEGIKKAREKLNDSYLTHLSLKGDSLQARISVGQSSDEAARLRLILEKLELNLGQQGSDDPRGLGSNNLLFMACELLLLGSDSEKFPILLIEEPEAHLHPQRQLRLMSFLQEQSGVPRLDGQQIQVIITTHSPNLASDIKLDNIVLIRDRKAFSLAEGNTKLDKSDYRFLERFLDVTKANLFFAKGVVVVEGDAESILLPTLARLIGTDFREHGISTVNVGGTGLRRYSRIFMRADFQKDQISTRVACIADLDVMPNCAPLILGLIKANENIPEKSKRRYRVRADIDDMSVYRETICARSAGQNVRTFVSDQWTLEYDLAFAGLGQEVWVAAQLANKDENIHAGKTRLWREIRRALRSFKALQNQNLSQDEAASTVYACFHGGASKAVAAQYLAEILEYKAKHHLTPTTLRSKLPPYIVKAIEYVTSSQEAQNA